MQRRSLRIPTHHAVRHLLGCSRVGVKHSLVSGLAGHVQSQAEAVRVGLLPEPVELVVLLSASLAAVYDVATVPGIGMEE